MTAGCCVATAESCLAEPHDHVEQLRPSGGRVRVGCQQPEAGLLDVIVRLRQGRTLLIATQQPAVIRRADRAITLTTVLAGPDVLPTAQTERLLAPVGVSDGRSARC